MPSAPSTIGDFSVLPVTIPPLPSFPRNAVHYLYVRRNTPKTPTPTDARSLFLTNVPVDSTEARLRALFAALVGAGRFESVTFEDERKDARCSQSDIDTAQPAHAARLLQGKKRKRGDDDNNGDNDNSKQEAAARLPSTWTRPLRRSGSTAVVLLADERSVEQVLKAVAKLHKTKKYPVWGGGGGGGDDKPLGSAWLRAHNRLSYPDGAALQASVDAFSALFSRREREAAEMAKLLRNEPDEDGFVTVTRGGRNAPASRNEADEAKRRMLEKQEKKKEELTNFYRFQLRERKKAEQAELLKRFDEDRRKLEAMRGRSGKFVPEA